MAEEIHFAQGDEFPIFDGKAGYWWILCVGQFWDAIGTPNTQRLVEAKKGLTGEALKWFVLWSRRNPDADWLTFEMAFIHRYQPDFRSVLPIFSQNEVFDVELEWEEEICQQQHEETPHHKTKLDSCIEDFYNKAATVQLKSPESSLHKMPSVLHEIVVQDCPTSSYPTDQTTPSEEFQKTCLRIITILEEMIQEAQPDCCYESVKVEVFLKDKESKSKNVVQGKLDYTYGTTTYLWQLQLKHHQVDTELPNMQNLTTRANFITFNSSSQNSMSYGLLEDETLKRMENMKIRTNCAVNAIDTKLVFDPGGVGTSLNDKYSMLDNATVIWCHNITAGEFQVFLINANVSIYVLWDPGGE